MKRITANQYQTSERYYKLPKILFEDERYMDMKLEVKVAYSILKDRLELSLSRGWIDEEGAVYLVFSNSKLMMLLGCSKSKLLSIKKTLKEYDLIDEVQQSSSEKGRLANKIYLGELSTTPVASSNRPSVNTHPKSIMDKSIFCEQSSSGILFPNFESLFLTSK